MWPNGTSCALALTFDFDAEEVWIAEDPANERRPGVLSQGTYGAKVAVPLVLELLARRGLMATFFVPGRVAERHPQRVREIVAAGHEVGLHGHTHRDPSRLSRTEEEAEIVASRRALVELGADPAGYRSPSWDLSESTLDLLAAHGLSYSSNLMDDIRPYRHGNGLIELPVQWLLDDAPHFWFEARASWNKKISTPGEVLELWQAEFNGIRKLGALCVLTMHPQFIGRPSRLEMLDAFLDSVTARGDVWIATAGEVARRADEVLPRGEQP
jgi:peptidoglycan/xylan/chitin deacetylase (PgdA/CDA1 family)